METIANSNDFIGQIFNDRYKVVEALHDGTGSSIFRAVHELMDKTVAIKMLSPSRAVDTISIKRFQQEAQAASHLSHPGVVTVFDYGFIKEGLPYLVMEYLPGQTMMDVVVQEGPLSVDRFRDLFFKLCKTLAYVHQQGVIHRDLKPSHFVITRYNPDNEYVKRRSNLTLVKGDELPVLVDFNLAKLKPSSGKESQMLEQQGEVIGTPLFMSPEHCLTTEIDERSDIYSLGCCMYYALTGTPPFQGTSIIDSMQMHMSSQPNGDRLPDEVKNIVQQTLEKNPSDRIQTMDELAELLRPTATSNSTESKKEEGKRKFWPF